MTKTNNPADSATRVKAFRERLAGSSYRRVEAYITDEEKARLDEVKASLDVTSDVAVAGLLRMGLEAYANSVGAQPSVITASAATDAPAVRGFSANASLNASPVHVQAMNICGALPETQAFLAASVSAAPTLPQATQSPEHNPIAQFFRKRNKETKYE